MSKNDGGPAFPKAFRLGEYGSFEYDDKPGMALRDYFAAAVLPEVCKRLCGEAEFRGWPNNWRNLIAKESYEIADAMLAERDKP